MKYLQWKHWSEIVPFWLEKKIMAFRVSPLKLNKCWNKLLSNRHTKQIDACLKLLLESWNQFKQTILRALDYVARIWIIAIFNQHLAINFPSLQWKLPKQFALVATLPFYWTFWLSFSLSDVCKHLALKFMRRQRSIPLETESFWM